LLTKEVKIEIEVAVTLQTLMLQQNAGKCDRNLNVVAKISKSFTLQPQYNHIPQFRTMDLT